MEAGGQYQYGVLLPHFGTQASRERVISSSRLIERLGFDSVWVRDHLVFHPHGMEGQDRTHIDPLVALSLVAGVTEKLIFGTGSLIPHRHPIHTALLLGSHPRSYEWSPRRSSGRTSSPSIARHSSQSSKRNLRS